MIILSLKKDVMSMTKQSVIKIINWKSKLTLNQIRIHNDGSVKGKLVRSLLLKIKYNKIISMERLNNVDMNNIQGATKVVGGYIQMDSVLVFALFDRSASHSFISTDLVKTIERVKCPTRKPLLVQTPLGEIQADQVCSNMNLVISKENFTVNLIVLESLDIPLVLGDGWLCAHKGVIYST